MTRSISLQIEFNITSYSLFKQFFFQKTTHLIPTKTYYLYTLNLHYQFNEHTQFYSSTLQ